MKCTEYVECNSFLTIWIEYFYYEARTCYHYWLIYFSVTINPEFAYPILSLIILRDQITWPRINLKSFKKQSSDKYFFPLLFFLYFSFTPKKSLFIVKLRSFQNASIEIEHISFVYQQNRSTVKKLICKMQN